MAKHRRYGIEVVEAVINREAVVAVFDRIEYPPAVPRPPNRHAHIRVGSLRNRSVYEFQPILTVHPGRLIHKFSNSRFTSMQSIVRWDSCSLYASFFKAM